MSGVSASAGLADREPQRTAAVTIGLVAVAAIAWVATVIRMSGMDAGPGTDPGSLGFYISTWIVMMVAMMLPSAVPSVRVETSGARAGAAFTVGYIGVWAAAGLIGYSVIELGRSVAPSAFAWDRAGRPVAAAVLALAAAYELRPLKRACLVRCVPPTSAQAAGDLAGLRLGSTNAGWCVGCCLGLMAALFALGSMSLVWMVLITVLIAAQKLLPRKGPGLVAAALVLAVLAIGLAASPGSVPGLTVPGGPAAMRAMHAMGAMGAMH
jgi:predicted metal-binding membrane protein